MKRNLPDVSDCKSMGDAAVRYAKEGWKIFPVFGVSDGICSCGDPECAHPGKHPKVNWKTEASNDIRTVRKLWKRHPDANIGLVPIGVSVIDVDSADAKTTLRDLLGKLPKPSVRTGRGWHYYVEGETKARNGVLPGVDIKSGPGSYLLAPPSRHISGKTYRYVRRADIGDAGPFIPLFQLLHKGAQSEEVVPIKEGRRNSWLTSQGGKLVRAGFRQPEISILLDDLNQRRCEVPLTASEVEAVAESVSRYVLPPAKFVRLSEVEVKEIDWLWSQRIPYGFVTLFDGDPGIGKSTLSMKIAASLTQGVSLPGGGDPGPANVLVVNAEDSPSHTLRPRLETLGADLERVHVLDNSLVLSADGIDQLTAQLEAHPAKLVVIDPLMAFVGSEVDVFRANEVRLFMQTLKDLAEQTGAAIICIRHLRKNTQGGALYRGSGSIDFIAQVRNGFVIGNDPDDKDARLVAHSKHNLTPPQPTLRFRLVSSSSAKGASADFVWDGKSEHDADAVVSAPGVPGRQPTQRNAAETFLIDQLSGGSMEMTTLVEAAEKLGIKKRTLDRAKKALGVRSEKKAGAWRWSLPDA